MMVITSVQDNLLKKEDRRRRGSKPVHHALQSLIMSHGESIWNGRRVDSQDTINREIQTVLNVHIPMSAATGL